MLWITIAVVGGMFALIIAVSAFLITSAGKRSDPADRRFLDAEEAEALRRNSHDPLP